MARTSSTRVSAIDKLLAVAAESRPKAIEILSEFGASKLADIEEEDDLQLVILFCNDELQKIDKSVPKNWHNNQTGGHNHG